MGLYDLQSVINSVCVCIYFLFIMMSLLGMQAHLESSLHCFLTKLVIKGELGFSKQLESKSQNLVVEPQNLDPKQCKHYIKGKAKLVAHIVSVLNS